MSSLSDEFPHRTCDLIVIHRGRIISSTDAADIGLERYFIVVLEAEGGEVTIHDCASYYEAVLAAEEAAHDWDTCVRDLSDDAPQGLH